MSGKLSIIATPIGNLGDITFRALWNLKECDAVYAEDTRVIAKLLAHYGLRKSVYRLDAATEKKKADEIVKRLEEGEHIVYVSDAGTPGVSDPGARLVRAVREQLPDLKIEAVPGPSALTATLSVAGVSADQFLFLGFLPHKKGRTKELTHALARKEPTVLFESTHRIKKLLSELDAHAPQRTVTVFKELTKLHENTFSGMPAEILETFEKAPELTKGEFVVIIDSV